jgi:hypothetical protein
LAILKEYITQREFVLGYLAYDLGIENVDISEDGTWSVADLTLVDPQSGQVVPAEPGLAIARLQSGEWNATLPADPGWTNLILSAPNDILTEEQKEFYIEINATARPTVSLTLDGYLLPWRLGKPSTFPRVLDMTSTYHPGALIMPSIFIFRRQCITYTHPRLEPSGWQSGMSLIMMLMVLVTTSFTRYHNQPITYQLYLHLAKTASLRH